MPAAGRPRWRTWLKSPWLWATVFGLIAIPAMRPFLVFEPAPPPVFFDLPAFSMLDQDGHTLGSSELEGKVWVASFLFTRCTTICPAITAAVHRLDDRYQKEGVEGIELVSFSVDPSYDTPRVLREFAASRSIDTERWHLVTSDEGAMRDLVVDGFKTPMGSPEPIEDAWPATEGDGSQHHEHRPGAEPEPTLIDVAHTGRLVLVDRLGGVRGYYEISTKGLDELFHRSQHVLAERRQPRARLVPAPPGTPTPAESTSR